MSSVSLTGFEYYISFIDDYSRKTWIYFLRSKKSPLVLRVFQVQSPYGEADGEEDPDVEIGQWG